MNGDRGLLTYDPSAKAVIFTRADEIKTSNSRSYRTTFLVRNSVAYDEEIVRINVAELI